MKNKHLFDGSSGDYLIAKENTKSQIPNIKPPHQVKQPEKRFQKTGYSTNSKYPYLQSKFLKNIF